MRLVTTVASFFLLGAVACVTAQQDSSRAQSAEDLVRLLVAADTLQEFEMLEGLTAWEECAWMTSSDAVRVTSSARILPDTVSGDARGFSVEYVTLGLSHAGTQTARFIPDFRVDTVEVWVGEDSMSGGLRLGCSPFSLAHLGLSKYRSTWGPYLDSLSLRALDSIVAVVGARP